MRISPGDAECRIDRKEVSGMPVLNLTGLLAFYVLVQDMNRGHYDLLPARPHHTSSRAIDFLQCGRDISRVGFRRSRERFK